ncbi:c-type cytochrome [Sulfurospirillum sp. 1612]|uniref:c-type cytochrome n=1 Tax=Sulfurospirillum sp. 1612 TaxID=3094835 RepID=UPI002F922811
MTHFYSDAQCGMKILRKFIALSSAAIFIPILAFGAGDMGKTLYDQGDQGAIIACSSCHGAQGQGEASTGMPALGDLQPAYTIKALQAFKSKERKNDIMNNIAAGLSEQQMQAVANYISTLPQPKPAAIKSKTLVEKGRILFEYGKKISATDWVPSCYLCHGQNAQGAGDLFPPLINQNAAYLKTQLLDFKSGKRVDQTDGLMKSIAEKLSKEDIDAISAYLASKSIVRGYEWPYKMRSQAEKKDKR